MEKLYQYVWKSGLLGRCLTLDDGRNLRIVNPGRYNSDSGPDFLAAKLHIDRQLWGGDVEIHVRASDWYVHGHDSDPAYDTVILHVVANPDRVVVHRKGGEIPQITATFPEQFFHLYAHLSEGIGEIRCNHQLKAIMTEQSFDSEECSSLVVSSLIERLKVERIQLKAQRIANEVENFRGDWEQACFVALARALGFGLNGDPFEMLARSLPLNVLHSHSDNLLQLEALLFGQAGMLDTSLHMFDEYYQLLCREYIFLARKYGLKPMRRENWKYSRTRPKNFPHRRIALLAQYIVGGFKMLSAVTEAASDLGRLYSILNKKAEGYWLTHSDFGNENHPGPVVLSTASLNLLLINFVAPMVYAYGAVYGTQEEAERGLDLWEKLPPEENMYIRSWRALGIKCMDAGGSQALIQLRREYCDAHRCLECSLGTKLLRNTIDDSYAVKK